MNKFAYSALILAIGVFLGAVLFAGDERDAPAVADETAMAHAEKHMDPEYVCPMHPQITDTRASSCPICGMDLEPRASGGGEDGGTVRVPAAMVNNLGIKLAHAEWGPVSEEVYASGFVTKANKAKQDMLLAKVDGKVLERKVAPGDWVQEDDVLLVIDYPPFKPLLDEYLAASDSNSGMMRALQLHKQLVEMGASDYALSGRDDERPQPDHLEIVAAFDGRVTSLLDVGEAVVAGASMGQLQAPSLAEVELRTYSRVARSVHEGSTGRLQVAHWPGRSWDGHVARVIHHRSGFYSSITFHVMVPPGMLELGAYAGAYIDSGTRERTLRVPANAIIYDEDSIRVVRWNGGEEFEAVEVKLGNEGHRWVEILDGLAPGDHVVTRGQFLIDSEATLQAGLERFKN